MTRFRTLLTVTAFGTIALQAAGAFAGGHSNRNGNLAPRYGVSASRQVAPPKHLPVRHPIDFPTGKPKGLAGLGQPAKGGQLSGGSNGPITAAAGPDIGGYDTLHDVVGAIVAAPDWWGMAQQLLKDKQTPK